MAASQHISTEVPLPVAAAALHLTWAQAYNELLSGRLKGVHRDGHWFVSRDSLDLLRKERGL